MRRTYFHAMSLILLCAVPLCWSGEALAAKGKKKAAREAAKAAAVTGGTGAPTTQGSPFPSATPQAVVEVTGKVFPSVVRIDVAQEIYAEGKRTLQRGIGSGVIIDAEGRVLTNFHVAGRGAEIY